MRTKRIDPLGWAILIITVFAAALSFWLTFEARAEDTNEYPENGVEGNIIKVETLPAKLGRTSEGNIGFNYSQIVDDTTWGVIGDYEHDAGPFDFEVEGQLQSGAIYNGTVDTAITFDVSAVGIRVFSNNKLKGYTLNGLGRTNDVGAALVIPTGDLEIAVGVFGRNGNPFGKPNAKDDLLPLGYDEDTLLSLGLDTLHPAPKGLTIEGGNSLNVSAETELEAGDFEIELKGLFEIAGEGQKVHQLLTNIATDGDLAIGLNWQAAVNIALQKYGENYEYESAWFVGVGKKF